MKLSYLVFLFLLILNTQLFANPPKNQYCVFYCTKEDTLFDLNHQPVINSNGLVYQCTNYINELHNGDCPLESHQGLNTAFSPTSCYRMKNYNGQNLPLDGHSYTDEKGIEWGYYSFTRKGESDNPKSYISFSVKTKECCLEIPLLKYKIVLFNFPDHPVKEGYYEHYEMDGTKFILESIRESAPDQPTNSVESRIIYDFQYLFEEYRNNLIVTNPNPFDREIKTWLPKEIVDSNTNLKFILKDVIGNKVAEQNVESINTNINTLFVNKGKYILFLYKNDEMLEYKQVTK